MSWNHGLPPIAQQRIDRQRASRVSGSLLSVGAAAAVRTAGLRPVGEVMGCTVMHLGWGGYQCGYRSSGLFGGSGPVPVIVSGDQGSGSRYAGYGLVQRADAYNRAWDSALNRLLLEAQALGADGVIGVRLTERVLDGANHEFVALGTAVGDGDPATPGAGRWPFCTELSGQDVAALRGAGWVPTGITIGLSMAVRHDDYGTQRAARSWSNLEIAGYSELLAASRTDARRQLWARAARIGGEQVVISSLQTAMFGREVSDGHTDHLAHTTIIGTALRRAAPGELPVAPTGSPRPLTLMPLSRSRGSR